MFPPRKTNFITKAFTLIELLVVMVIIAVLAAIISPVLIKVRNVGDQTKALANIRTIGTATLAFAAENDGTTLPVYKDYYLCWVYQLAEGGYVNDGISVKKPDGSWDRRVGWVSLYNPITYKLNPKAYNAGGYGLNCLSDLYTGVKIINITSPSKIVLIADSHIFSNGTNDWAICGISGYKLYPNTHNNQSANYVFYDGHAVSIKANQPNQTNSEPLGYGKSIFFLADQSDVF